ncbi:MAG: hypothetical protein JO322_04615 [Candidatus Eremiobacteraeota bacterium]|nr:hypothetical protein [Candidatus Eremiobacteraeota bacterium]
MMLRPGTTFIPAQALMEYEGATQAPVFSVDEVEAAAGIGLGCVIDVYA